MSGGAPARRCSPGCCGLGLMHTEALEQLVQRGAGEGGCLAPAGRGGADAGQERVQQDPVIVLRLRQRGVLRRAGGGDVECR
jgi:hypothetical protein